MAKCDGLEYPCDNNAVCLVVIDSELDAKGMNLCDACYSELIDDLAAEAAIGAGDDPVLTRDAWKNYYVEML